MRFYKNRQAEMLKGVSYFLKKNRDKLAAKVPAMANFIDEFVKKEATVYSIRIGNPNLVKMNTLEKQSIKKEFVKVVAKLIAVLNADGFKIKGRPLPEMKYSVRDLNKIPADKLCETYIKASGAVKKIKTLTFYGLSEGDLREMHAYYKEFSGIKKAPALKKKEVALNNKQLNEGVKDCINYLEKHIDGLMLLAAEDEPALQSDYKALRRVLPRVQGRPSDDEVKYRKSRERKE